MFKDEKLFSMQHPGFVLTLFYGFLTWQALIYESAFLGAFGIVPTHYAQLEDFLTLAFRRPENLIWPALWFFGPVLLIDFAINKLERDEGRNYLLAPGLVALIYTLFASAGGFPLEAAYRAERIKSLTPESVATANLNNLLLMSFSTGSGANRKDTEQAILLGRLGTVTFVFDMTSQRVLQINNNALVTAELDLVPRLSTGAYPDRDTNAQPNTAADTDTDGQ